MAEEPGGIVFTPSSGGTMAGSPLFPKEFQRGVFSGFDRQFLILLLICGAVIFTVVGILSMHKPAETISNEEITKIQERYARLVLNQPKPVIEPNVEEVKERSDTKTETGKTEEKKEEVKIDRKKETFAEREKRKESGAEQRRKVREQAAKQIQAAGIFAAITAAGGGTGTGSPVSDLLGTAGIGVSELGNLSLDKGTFATKNVDAADLVTQKRSRTEGVGIEKEQLGRTAVTQVASNVNVNITSKPPEVSGESASMQERSQSAIQNVVSRQSRRLKRLYEEWLKRDPALNGRLTVKFVILPSGAVANVSIVKTTTNNNDFDQMVLRYIKRWQFPAVEGGGPVEVVYPFVFEGQS